MLSLIRKNNLDFHVQKPGRSSDIETDKKTKCLKFGHFSTKKGGNLVIKKQLKAFSWVLVSLLLLSTMAGCTNSKKETAEKTADQEINLKFIWWGKEQRKQDTLKVIELYEKAHPNVHITTEDYSVKDDVATQLAMETADQNTADIIQADYEFIFDYINRDLIQPLNPYIKDKILSTSDISPETLTPGMKGKELYALTIGMNSEAFLYDPELFEEAGIPVPSKDYTIDELYTTLVQLKEAIDTPDFYPLDNMLNVNYYLRARGFSMYNPDGTDLGYKDDQIMADYFALFKKWSEEGLINKDSLKEAPLDENHPIITGKSAFYSGYSNNTTALTKLAGHTIKLLPLPTITKESEGRFIKPSMFLAVSSYSKYPEEAARFVDFFVNNTEANEILKGERGVPVSSVISEKLSAKLDEAGKQQYELLDYLKTHSSPINPPSPSSAIIINNAFQLILKYVSDGSTSPDQGAREFRSEATVILQGKKEAASK